MGEVVLDGNFEPIPRDPKENEFVLVLFPLKKTFVYYVDFFLEKIDDNDDDSDFFVSFLRLKIRRTKHFASLWYLTMRVFEYGILNILYCLIQKLWAAAAGKCPFHLIHLVSL